MSKRMTTKLALLTLTLLMVGYGALLLSRSTTYMVAGDIIARVETDSPVIALTFDDGPSPRYLDDVLNILSQEDVPATFYLVGHDVAAHPNLVSQIADAGHEIGNHSFDHARMALKPPDLHRATN